MILKNLEFQAALRVIPIINIKILSANFTFISFEISSDFVVIKPLSVFKCMYRVIKRCAMFYGTSVVPYFLVSWFNS